jgi:hypothetical protein
MMQYSIKILVQYRTPPRGQTMETTPQKRVVARGNRALITTVQTTPGIDNGNTKTSGLIAIMRILCLSKIPSHLNPSSSLVSRR